MVLITGVDSSSSSSEVRPMLRDFGILLLFGLLVMPAVLLVLRLEALLCRGGAAGLVVSPASSVRVSELFLRLGATCTVVMESGLPVCERYCRGPSYPCSSRLLELPGLLWPPALRSLNSIRLF